METRPDNERGAPAGTWMGELFMAVRGEFFEPIHVLAVDISDRQWPA